MNIKKILKQLDKDLDENKGITIGNDIRPYILKALRQTEKEVLEEVVEEIDKPSVIKEGYAGNDRFVKGYERFRSNLKHQLQEVIKEI